MAQSQILTTARTRVIPFSTTYLTPRYVAWLNDPEVVRYSEQRHRRHDLESCRRYLESFEGTPHFFWAISETASGLGHIGNINAYVDPRNGVADVGILLGEKAVWGKGYGAEVWLAVCRFLLIDQSMRKVTAGTLAINAGMVGIMRRCGMRDDGRRARQAVIEGKETDEVYAALFREDLQAAGTSG